MSLVPGSGWRIHTSCVLVEVVNPFNRPKYSLWINEWKRQSRKFPPTSDIHRLWQVSHWWWPTLMWAAVKVSDVSASHVCLVIDFVLVGSRCSSSSIKSYCFVRKTQKYLRNISCHGGKYGGIVKGCMSWILGHHRILLKKNLSIWSLWIPFIGMIANIVCCLKASSEGRPAHRNGREVRLIETQ